MPLIFSASQLIDGISDAPVEDGLVAVAEGRISYAGPASGFGPLLEGAQVLRREGTLLPGLVDAHQHITWSASLTPMEDCLSEGDGEAVLRGAENIKRALMSGVTTIRECGGRNTTTLDLRSATRKGVIAGPELLVCGRPLTITGGHCYFMNGEADGVEGVRRAVRQLAKEGVDFIKIMATGGNSTPGTLPHLPSYCQEELQAATDEAHRQGLSVAAHCHATQGIKYCLQAGVDTIEHATFMGSDRAIRFDPWIAEEIAKKGIWVIPTISAGYRKYLCASETGPSAGGFVVNEQRDATKLGVFRGLLEAGVRLAAGTDAGVPRTPSDSLPQELWLMMRGGMSSMEAIRAATIGSALALGIADQVGTLQVGKQADFIIVEGDPLKDISALLKASVVVKKGKIIRA